jgi:hypothetical protein
MITPMPWFPPLDKTLVREVLARIDDVLVGRRRDLFNADDYPDRLFLFRLQQLLRDLLEPPPPKEGHTPPAWLVPDQDQILPFPVGALLMVPDQERLLDGLAEEVQKEIQRTGKKRGALTAVVRRFAQTHGLTAKQEGSLRVMLYAHLRKRLAGPGV